jgi:hypothetical protein
MCVTFTQSGSWLRALVNIYLVLYKLHKISSKWRNPLMIQADIRSSAALAMKILILLIGEYCLALTACRN